MIDESTKNDILNQAIKEYEIGTEFRQRRMRVWQDIEDLYSMKPRPVLRGRFYIPVPVMSGFIHTLQSKIDDAPVLNFSHDGNEADYKKGVRLQAGYEKISNDPERRWDATDRGGKRHAIFSGRSVDILFGESPFAIHYENVDYYDVIADPTGGANIENHNFFGRDSVWRNKWWIMEGAKSGRYDSDAVRRLVMSQSQYSRGETAQKEFQEKYNRFTALHLDPTALKYVMPGQEKYKLVEQITHHKGERYYILYSYQYGLALRCVPIKQIFKSGLMPFNSWAPYEDEDNFWSLAPAEEMIPVTDAIITLISQAFENRQKINWDMKAVDPNIFPDPRQLEYRPDGIVLARATRKGVPISSGIYQFQTQHLEGTIDLVAFLDSFVGQKTGVTPSTQGVAEQNKRVGIYYGELQQVADRLGLVNKSYSECWERRGIRFVHALRENINDEKIAIKLIGEKGVEWKELSKEDLSPATTYGDDGTGQMVDFDISVRAASSKLEADELTNKRKEDTLLVLLKLGLVSKDFTANHLLSNAHFTDEEVREARDLVNEGSKEILSEAAEENERMALGETVKPNRGATTGHIAKHMAFLEDMDLDPIPMQAVMEHIKAEMPLVAENMARKAILARAAMPPAEGSPAGGAAPLPAGLTPTPGALPPAGGPAMATPANLPPPPNQ